MVTDRARTPAEKRFKAAMRKAGWQVYRDSATGRLVTNLYRREVHGLSKQLGIALEIVCSEDGMVKASLVEVATPAAAVNSKKLATSFVPGDVKANIILTAAAVKNLN